MHRTMPEETPENILKRKHEVKPLYMTSIHVTLNSIKTIREVKTQN